ncbi:MAG: hypothetical protein JRF47_11435 [Deltaproteobacteria bacterium]|nr:hypothetical protein [Deltaproteobacteria bacterium]
MLLKRIIKLQGLQFINLLCIVALGLMTIIACGGGGDDGVVTPVQGTIDSSTAPQIASAIGNITTGIEAATLPITLDIASGAYSPKTLLKHADDLIFNKEKTEGDKLFGAYSSLHPAGSSSEQSNCTGGGSVTTTLTWDGPDDPADCSQVQNATMELTFVNCQEGSNTMNGIMAIDFQGDLCAITPSELRMYFNNLRYQNQVDNSDITLNLTMDFTGIQYDENEYMTGMSISLDGSINGTFEETPVEMDYNNWMMAFSSVKYDGSNEMVEATLTINGSFSGTIDGNQFNESYKNVAISAQETIADSVPGEFITINGQYKGACLNGWVTIETIEPVFFPESSQCPTSGQVKLSGNGEATIAFHNDGSVTINVSGEDLGYTTCDDLPICI